MKPSRETMLLPSVFDRLMDVSRDGPDSERWYDVDRLTRAVRRDLEDLLNTHQAIPHLGIEFPRLAESVVGYGVPDPSEFPLETPAGRRRFAVALSEVIRRHEPRLNDVRIEVVSGDSGQQRELDFRVIGRLAVEPAPRVVFESKLHVPTGQFSISGDGE